MIMLLRKGPGTGKIKLDTEGVEIGHDNQVF
jgi:hypothetical protein